MLSDQSHFHKRVEKRGPTMDVAHIPPSLVQLPSHFVGRHLPRSFDIRRFFVVLGYDPTHGNQYEHNTHTETDINTTLSQSSTALPEARPPSCWFSSQRRGRDSLMDWNAVCFTTVSHQQTVLIMMVFLLVSQFCAVRAVRMVLFFFLLPSQGIAFCRFSLRCAMQCLRGCLLVACRKEQASIMISQWIQPTP